MKTSLYIIVFCLLFIGCQQKPEKVNVDNVDITSPKVKDTIIDTVATQVKSPREDSIEILKVLKAMYKWHDEHKGSPIDFDVIVVDSFQTGLNFKAFEKRVSEIKNAPYFTEGFLKNYQKLGSLINNKLKNAHPKYLNEINFSSQDADPWNWFQDDAESFWNRLLIKDFKLSGDNASLKWFLKYKYSTNPIEYSVKFTREDNSWKVAYLEGFDIDKFYQ